MLHVVGEVGEGRAGAGDGFISQLGLTATVVDNNRVTARALLRTDLQEGGGVGAAVPGERKGTVWGNRVEYLGSSGYW